MDLKYKIYFDKTQNELNLTQIIYQLSSSPDKQKEFDNITKVDSYYSAVITHAHYVIFYTAKAYLEKKGIKTQAPEEHKKTYEEFARFVEQGKIDMELLSFYKELLFSAQELLGIFKLEKSKRGKFTYYTLPQANMNPSRESLKNATQFFINIRNIID